MPFRIVCLQTGEGGVVPGKTVPFEHQLGRFVVLFGRGCTEYVSHQQGDILIAIISVSVAVSINLAGIREFSYDVDTEFTAFF